jgi:hypothetical protein
VNPIALARAVGAGVTRTATTPGDAAWATTPSLPTGLPAPGRLIAVSAVMVSPAETQTVQDGPAWSMQPSWSHSRSWTSSDQSRPSALATPPRRGAVARAAVSRPRRSCWSPHGLAACPATGAAQRAGPPATPRTAGTATATSSPAMTRDQAQARSRRRCANVAALVSARLDAPSAAASAGSERSRSTTSHLQSVTAHRRGRARRGVALRAAPRLAWEFAVRSPRRPVMLYGRRVGAGDCVSPRAALANTMSLTIHTRPGSEAVAAYR